jgi:hypothetical protein
LPEALFDLQCPMGAKRGANWGANWTGANWSCGLGVLVIMVTAVGQMP